MYFFTWVFTGHRTYGEFGHTASLHFPSLGIWFVLIVPVLAGLLYGPLIQRFAREARGHGVPEVMLAVAENGGRIRPPVTVVKALASALCIGGGGSVGREGPIVQIGSALASTLGQWVRMSEGRLRVIVACGAAGAISATFNAPITGVFFGFEIVLKEFSLDALSATILSAVTGDVISRAFFGGAPFFMAVPHDLTVTNDVTYLLVGVLGITAGLIGVAFQKTLYKGQDAADAVWANRPEWLRPVAGGLLLGLVLLALPQMYGVGYPVMDRVFGGHYVLWFIVLLMVGKILAASLTLWIGGSGGVFAPSLFIGATAGSAFGIIVNHVFGSAVGPPALYGVVAMGGVFAAAAQAPLTAIASVAEMTGNFTLALPIMLACGISAQLAKRLTHGSIYTTKLLRRGIDIERPKAIGALQALTVAEVMQPLANPGGESLRFGDGAVAERPAVDPALWERLVGPVTLARSATGPVRRRGSRTSPATARALRPRRPTRALARRRAARVADPRRRAARARDHVQHGRTRDRGGSHSGRIRGPTTRRQRSTLPARHCADTRCSSCGSCRTLRPAGVASATSRGPRAAPSSQSRKNARSTPHDQTSSCIPASGRSCSRQPRTIGRHTQPLAAVSTGSSPSNH